MGLGATGSRTGVSLMDYVNSVHLVGRVTASGEPRELPSGDTVVTLPTRCTELT